MAETAYRIFENKQNENKFFLSTLNLCKQFRIFPSLSYTLNKVNTWSFRSLANKLSLYPCFKSLTFRSRNSKSKLKDIPKIFNRKAKQSHLQRSWYSGSQPNLGVAVVKLELS